MTISIERVNKRYQGNGVTTVFPYDFLIPEESSLFVYLYDSDTNLRVLLSAGVYSVSGINDPAFGSVTYPLSGDPLDSTQYLIIVRAVPYAQGLDIQTQGFYAESLEDQLDRIVMQIQQLANANDRAIVAQEGDTFTPLPLKADMAGMLLGFDVTGEPIAVESINEKAERVAVDTDHEDRIEALEAVALGSGNFTVASQAQAEAGAENTKGMTPLRVSQHIDERQRTDSIKRVGTIALMKGLLKANLAGSQIVHASGYATANNPGGGDFGWNASSAEAVDPGVVFASNEGGNGRWKRRSYLTDKYVTPTMFEAIGDSGTDDKARIVDALTFCGATKTPLLVDRLYWLASSITLVVANEFPIFQRGFGTAGFVFTTVDAGINLKVGPAHNTGNPPWDIKLGLYAGIDSCLGPALSIGHVNPRSLGTQFGGKLELQVGNAPGMGYSSLGGNWINGLQIENMTSVKLSDSYFRGQSTSMDDTVGYAVDLKGKNTPGPNIDNFHAYGFDVGVRQVDTSPGHETEGTQITNFEMVGVGYGVDFDCSGPSDEDGAPGFRMALGHINATKGGVRLNAANGTLIDGVLFYRRRDSTGDYAHIELTDCRQSVINNCNPELNGASGDVTFLKVTGQEDLLVDNCVPQGCEFGVVVTDGPTSTGIRIGANVNLDGVTSTKRIVANACTDIIVHCIAKRYEVISTDALVNIRYLVQGAKIRDTAVLNTADRNFQLTIDNVVDGAAIKFVRTGTGAHNRLIKNIAGATLKTMGNNTECEVTFNLATNDWILTGGF